jgi:hypothetical protein
MRYRPTISDRILRGPDIDYVVKLAAYECYAQNLLDVESKNRNLLNIGRAYKILRESGLDSPFLDYSYADLLDIETRAVLINKLKGIMDLLEEENLQKRAVILDDDVFLKYLTNNIRNDVVSFQAFVFKKINESYSNLLRNLELLKADPIGNFELISVSELKLREINENKINADLEKNRGGRITPFSFTV